MNNEKTWITCREAAVLLNFSQRHIINLIKKGKLSASKDEDGKYYIQKSEFYRVYPNTMNQEPTRISEKLNEDNSVKLLEEEIKHLKEMLSEKNKHNEFITEQLSNFTVEKSKMLDAINGHTRLLEYKESNTKANDKENKPFNWRKFFRRD